MLLLLVGVILLICCICFPKKKRVSLIMFVYMYILMAGQYAHADYFSARKGYYNCFSRSIIGEDPLYNIIERLFNRCGFSYETFIAICTLIALLLLANLMYKFTDNLGFVLACFFTMPFILDIVEYNNFLGMTFCLYASQYVISGNINLRKAIVYLLIGAGICSYNVIFFLILLIPFLNAKRIIKVIIIVCGIISMSNALIYQISVRFISEDKVSFYLKKISKQNTIYALDAIVLIGIVITMIAYYISIRHTSSLINQITEGVRYKDFALMVVKVNIIMLIVIPLQHYTLEVARIYQNILLLNYMFFSYLKAFNIVENKIIINARNMICRIIMVALCVVYFYIYCVYWNYDSVFEPIFYNNRFIDFLF